MSARLKICAVLLAVALLAVVLVAAAANSAPEPWRGLAHGADVVRGQFSQKKYLAELKQPLVSTGTFVVARGHGLIWRIQKPVASTLVITRARLVEKTGDQTTRRLSAAEQPGLNVVTAVLLALFNADTARLRDFFEITVSRRAPDDWRLELRPKRDGVARVVTSAAISGGATVDTIRVRQPSGDRTVIRLHTKKQARPALTADERRLLNDS